MSVKSVRASLLAIATGLAILFVSSSAQTSPPPPECFKAICTACQGSGTSPFQCNPCKGSGKDMSGFRCNFCNGKGFGKCLTCNGTGQQ